ncbi:hypothetical protein [Pseudomonas schmalbachii]|uniref:hypothetical protein n=1 Tax=Pseudomonas schmalbachii TaxID=2816993 RepID=UPI001F3978BF|nr:hypothetical protein [Pseudomonas schmalbachii]
MASKDHPAAREAFWQQLCADSNLDPQKRLAARKAILAHADAQDCSLYRPDENDPDAEEMDLGDARIVVTGPFQAPAEWSAEEREEYFGDADPASFVSAFIECEAEPGSREFFQPDVGDYVAVMPTPDAVVMYYLHDWYEDDNGRDCVLILDDQDLD